MVKLLILMVIVFSIWAIINGRSNQSEDKTAHQPVFYLLHPALGTIATLFFTIHGISKLQHASLGACLTGGITLLLFYVELILGIFCVRKKQESSIVNTIHKMLPVVIIGLIVLHLIFNH